jgi:hypothetical protein
MILYVVILLQEVPRRKTTEELYMHWLRYQMLLAHPSVLVKFHSITYIAKSGCYGTHAQMDVMSRLMNIGYMVMYTEVAEI